MRVALGAVLLTACLPTPHELIGAACDTQHACPNGMYCVPVTDGGDGSACSTTPPRQPTTFFIAPSGDDDADGSEATPWKTWSNALSRLFPGDTLIAMDGVWTDARNCTGACVAKLPLPDIDCTDTGVGCAGHRCRSGAEGLPITVRAQHERQVLLKADGTLNPLRFASCAYWNVEGLRLESTDKSTATGAAGVLAVSGSHDLQFKRLLIARPNRFGNNHMAQVLSGSHDVLFEDTELYDFHRVGFYISTSQRVTLRRCYVNSRLTPDIDGGYHSYSPSRGDQSYLFTNTSDSVVENCISENDCGLQLTRGGCDTTTGSCANVHVYGSAFLDEEYAVMFESDAAARSGLSLRDGLTDVVLVRPTVWSLFPNATIDSTFRNVSVFGASTNGFQYFDNATGAGNGVDCPVLADAGFACSTTLTNALLVEGQSRGLYQRVPGLTASYVNEWGSPLPLHSLPDAGNVLSNLITVAPTGMGLDAGACLVYVPATSPMHGAGETGADIGANLVYRYVDGRLTGDKLWSADGGAFPCGAVVPGVNDVAGASCRDVHVRLNVGAPGCPVP